MTAATVHRIIEQHASSRAGRVAIADGEREITYRDLNCAANTLARRLQAQGFRRGSHATITMGRGIDLAVTLLAVLKLGGSYTWCDLGSLGHEPAGLSFSLPASASRHDNALRHDGASRHDSASRLDGGPSRHETATGGEARYLHLDLEPTLTDLVAPSPNLPIVTRPTDIACVLKDGDGAAVCVPHATIAAITERGLPESFVWTGEPGALDLWFALVAGDTVVVADGAAAAA